MPHTLAEGSLIGSGTQDLRLVGLASLGAQHGSEGTQMMGGGIQQVAKYLLDIGIVSLRQARLQVTNVGFLNQSADLQRIGQGFVALDNKLIIECLEIGVGEFSELA